MVFREWYLGSGIQGVVFRGWYLGGGIQGVVFRGWYLSLSKRHEV